MLKRCKRILTDNSGDTSMQMMIIMLIAFVAGAILLAAIFGAFDNLFGNGTSNKITDIMN